MVGPMVNDRYILAFIVITISGISNSSSSNGKHLHLQM